MYYNYQKMTNDLYALMDMECNRHYEHTLRIMIDECVYHFLKEHNVPPSEQAIFLGVMFPENDRVVQEYKNKKFSES